jgi:hypothetical protein
MKLSLRDRFTILNVLPDKGNLATIKIVHNLKMNLSLSKEEFEDLEIKEKDGLVYWNDEKEKKYGEKEIDISGKSLSIVLSAFDKLDKEEELTDAHLQTYLKISGEKE